MALYAFDGTWNEDEGNPESVTNVVKFREAYQSTANWFELIGSIDDDGDSFFRIGERLGAFCPPDDGDLYAFSNDLSSMYANNSGEIKVEVTRLD